MRLLVRGRGDEHLGEGSIPSRTKAEKPASAGFFFCLQTAEAIRKINEKSIDTKSGLWYYTPSSNKEGDNGYKGFDCEVPRR